MKKINILFWVFNGLLCAFMLFSAISGMTNATAKSMITDHLHYPEYFLPLLNIAKILGVIAIVVPGFKRLKEWAYAGFAFDLIWATYSTISVGDPASSWGFMSIFFILFALAYIYHIKKQNAAVGSTN